VRITTSQGDVCESNFVSGEQAGHSKLTTKHNNVFEGQWAFDKTLTEHSITLSNGRVLAIRYKDGTFEIELKLTKKEARARSGKRKALKLLYGLLKNVITAGVIIVLLLVLRYAPLAVLQVDLKDNLIYSIVILIAGLALVALIYIVFLFLLKETLLDTIAEYGGSYGFVLFLAASIWTGIQFRNSLGVIYGIAFAVALFAVGLFLRLKLEKLPNLIGLNIYRPEYYSGRLEPRVISMSERKRRYERAASQYSRGNYYGMSREHKDQTIKRLIEKESEKDRTAHKSLEDFYREESEIAMRRRQSREELSYLRGKSSFVSIIIAFKVITLLSLVVLIVFSIMFVNQYVFNSINVWAMGRRSNEAVFYEHQLDDPYQFGAYFPHLELDTGALITDIPIFPGISLQRNSQANSVSDVMRIQEKLNEIGVYQHNRLVVDGNFGPLTEAAIMGFQRLIGADEDGIVNEFIWTEIFLWQLPDFEMQYHGADATIFVTTANLNFRELPSRDSASFEVVPVGTQVVVVGVAYTNNERWYRVEYGWRTGYMYAEFLDPIN
jgi:peptidoglycan hydrolase-like protein with peptidoglycan-binding domain